MVVTVLVQHMPTSSHRKNGYIGVLGFSLCVVQVLPVLPPWSYVEELYGATSGGLMIPLGVPDNYLKRMPCLPLFRLREECTSLDIQPYLD